MSRAQSLLFLPGASGNRDFWRPVSDRLRHPAQRHFLAYPGLGGVPTDPDVKSFEDLVTRVTRAIDRPSALIAQSMGGVLAVLATLERPELVTQLVLTVTSGGIARSEFGAVDWRPEFLANHPHAPRWLTDDRSDVSPRLHEITAPVLLLWGDADPISPVAIGQRLAELLPNAELVVIAGGTHDLAVERADEVSALIESHWRRVG